MLKSLILEKEISIFLNPIIGTLSLLDKPGYNCTKTTNYQTVNDTTSLGWELYWYEVLELPIPSVSLRIQDYDNNLQYY